jgi:DNA-binding response OmpR family regulator
MDKNTKRILIIAEDLIMVALIRKILTDKINSIAIVEMDSNGAFNVNDGFEYKTIIVDGTVNGTTGLEIIDHLRFAKKYIGPLIYITNSDDESVKALKFGANLIITLPIATDHLISVVTKNLGA